MDIYPPYGELTPGGGIINCRAPRVALSRAPRAPRAALLASLGRARFARGAARRPPNVEVASAKPKRVEELRILSELAPRAKALAGRPFFRAFSGWHCGFCACRSFFLARFRVRQRACAVALPRARRAGVRSSSREPPRVLRC